jgi:tRNA (cmo5U34)-methyltransferase
MSQFHFRPDYYLDLMHAEVPAYEELQDRVAAAADGLHATRILELGTGTGETARRVLSRHPQARLTGIDISAEMLAVASQTLPPEQIEELVTQGLQDPLPEGPFDLAVSALTVHHLDGSGKADLFRRLSRSLCPGGRFVMGDVVVPDDPADAVTPLSPSYDTPSPINDLLDWLGQAGFEAHVLWQVRDLSLISADC